MPTTLSSLNEAVDVLIPDPLVWTAALERWHAPRAPDGQMWLRRYGRWYHASGWHVRAPLELVLAWVAEDEGMATAARALAELAGGGVVDCWPADEWCSQFEAEFVRLLYFEA